MPAQQRFFEQEIVAKFNKEHNCKISVAPFMNQLDIEKFLKLDAGKAHPEIGLVKTPFEATRVLVYKGYMMPLTAAEDSVQVMQDLAEYHQLAAGLGYVNGQPYYIPRKLETRVLFYRKSMVADAVSKFDKYKKQIDEDLKKQNRFGLPKDYALESDPSQWDIYDLFVVGYIWSKEEYNGVKMPRLAHRGAKYEGTALDLVDRALQLGATSQDILTLGDKTAETFLWENVFIRNGLYNPGMWQDPWRGSDLYNAIKDGKVFCTYLQQIDCFNVHGWADDPGMPSYLPDVKDMGLSVVPKAVSFELDATGQTRDRRDAHDFDRRMVVGDTQDQPQCEACLRVRAFRHQPRQPCQGMLQVRHDSRAQGLLLNLPSVFDEGWVGEIFKTSVDQINLNMTNNSSPRSLSSKGIPKWRRTWLTPGTSSASGTTRRRTGKSTWQS